jgi:enamine deaminase RidA (YjgF/YER057c/UK114 family)
MSEAHRVLQPAAWPRPSGYSNGMIASGQTLYLAGQIGWDATTRELADGMAAQVEQALCNIVMLVAEAGGAPDDIVRLTWFVTDIEQYRRERRSIGEGYRRVMGRHFPAMSVIGAERLVEEKALVEIEATAVLRR